MCLNCVFKIEFGLFGLFGQTVFVLFSSWDIIGVLRLSVVTLNPSVTLFGLADTSSIWLSRYPLILWLTISFLPLPLVFHGYHHSPEKLSVCDVSSLCLLHICCCIWCKQSMFVAHLLLVFFPDTLCSPFYQSISEHHDPLPTPMLPFPPPRQNKELVHGFDLSCVYLKFKVWYMLIKVFSWVGFFFFWWGRGGGGGGAGYLCCFQWFQHTSFHSILCCCSLQNALLKILFFNP